MKMVLSSQRTFLSIGLPILLFIGLVFLANSQLMNEYPDLAIGIIYDLTLVVPSFYLILIWRTPVKKITVVPFFIAGILAASALIPSNQTYHLNLVKTFILPVVELGVITLIIIKVRQTVKIFKLKSAQQSDFYLTLKASAQKVLESERIGNVFATEIGMIYYAFFTWRKKPKNENQFTGYRKNGIIAILVAVIFVALAETIGLHILLMKWNIAVAWVVFGLSLYAVVQITGHLKALMRRLVEVNTTSVSLKYGLFGDTEIEFDNIERIEQATSVEEGRNVQKMALLADLEGLNMVLYLKEEVIIEKAYGLKKKADVIQFYLDEPAQFEKKLIENINA